MAAKTDKPVNPTAAYLEKLGVTVDPAALEPPDISALAAVGLSEHEWLDKHGDPVPGDLELYRIGLAGKEANDRVIAAKKAEGFSMLPDGHGFRMRGLHTDGERVMFRTAAQRDAAHRAAQLAQARRRQGVQRGRHVIAGAPDAIETELTTQDVPLRA